MWCCFRPKVVENGNIKNFSKEERENHIPTAGGFHNDIVYYKFLNADTYELDIVKIQVWIFDKNQICVHASDNEYKADFYVGKNLSDVILKEDVLDTFKDIHTLALSSIESKRTVMINNTLAYIEGRTLYYNEDINDVYGSMLVFIPYKNVVPTQNRSGGGSGTYVLKGNTLSESVNTPPKAASLDSPFYERQQLQSQNNNVQKTRSQLSNGESSRGAHEAYKTHPPIKRTMSDSKLHHLDEDKKETKNKDMEFEKKKADLISKLQELIDNK
jgi:hypothetical protein